MLEAVEIAVPSFWTCSHMKRRRDQSEEHVDNKNIENPIGQPGKHEHDLHMRCCQREDLVLEIA